MMPGLRWVPVPLAILMALLGWLVFGSVAGQHALAASHAGPQAGGLELTVNQVVWMADDMTDPSQKGTPPGGFQMPASEMPGMQTVGEKRLRVELYVRDTSGTTQVYSQNGFRLLGKDGRSWAPLVNAATRGAILSETLYPGFQSTLDLYFDLPDSQGGSGLRIEWEHGGTIVTFPIHLTGVDSSGLMVGM